MTTITELLVIDNAAPYSDRQGNSRLTVGCVLLEPPGPGGLLPPATMPVMLTINDPTDEDIATWKPGAQVERTYAIAAKKADPSS